MENVRVLPAKYAYHRMSTRHGDVTEYYSVIKSLPPESHKKKFNTEQAFEG